MAQYKISGNRVEVIPDGAIDIQSKLPPATYFLKFEKTPAFQGFFLEKGNNFSSVEKVYGDLKSRTNRIVETYLDRKKRGVNTGVLLSGIKGSGKTLQSKMVSNTLLTKYKIPTIIIADAFDTAFLSLWLKDLTDPALILFEEFEKIYSSRGSLGRKLTYGGRPGQMDEAVDVHETSARMNLADMQDGLLTLLDGVMNSNKLFIFTCNTIAHVNDLLINRPGRVWYHFKYAGLDDEVVKSYCEEKMKNPDDIKAVMQIADYLDEGFTFDILQSIVEETHRQNVSPLEAMEFLNVEPQPFSSWYEYEVIREDGKLEIYPSLFNKSCTIDNYLSDEPIDISFEVIARNSEEVKMVKSLNASAHSASYRSRFNSYDDDVEECSGVGFGPNSSRGTVLRCNLILNKANLVKSSKKELIYSKFGFKVVFTKVKRTNYWSNLLLKNDV